MSVAAKEIVISKNGVNKREVEILLQRISEQVRWIDQKITMKIDNEIWQNFQSQQNEINFTKSIINQAKKKSRCQ